ncbi:MAG: hypothetical protein PHC60_06535 [Heliobacteriaceae bacterium]|nr:hypothetical protein [Heliobacteriaceae bacterium]MDD4588024.1 hypothetical protein [Heliobacteriaceae bacterium]
MFKLAKAGYPTPYVFIQGEPRFAGDIAVDPIKEAVGSLLQV